jgi:nucleotide-binding universal stress UspA family protein
MILIGYDGSDDARAAIAQAAKLLPGGRATVLTVWEPFVQVMARTGAGLGLSPTIVDYDEIDAASERSARERADEGVALARDAGLTAAPRAVEQHTTTSAAILEQAAEIEAEAIVVGSRGLTGIKSLLLGSVSHGIVQHADRPVIVVPSPDIARKRAAY